MQEVAEASEEVLWTVGFAVVTGTTWGATMLGAWAGTF